MNPANKDQIDAFISALQLCIKGGIWVFHGSDSKKPAITFLDSKPSDEAVVFFTKIIGGKWLSEKQYEILDADLAFSQEFRYFLLLTRLVKENMLKAAEIDSTYEKYVQKLSLKRTSAGVSLNNLEQAKNVIFDHIKENQITFKALANKAGLTAMALSNFRSGADMRLSSFLKITQALGLKVVIQH